jgi:ATP/maltotriose-dependent transcriptional regulator MalT
VLAAHGQILMLRGMPRESRSRCEQAIEVARSVGARAEEAHALNTLGVDISSLGDRPRGIDYLKQAKEIAEELGWIDEMGRVYVNLSEEIDWDGRTSEAVELTLEGADAMRRLGARSYVAFLETEAAQRLIRLGRLAEAAEAVRRLSDTGAYGLGLAICGDAEADLALARGDLVAAADALGRARAGLGLTRDSMFYGPTAAIEVELALADPDADAPATFERSLERISGDEYAFSTARLYARGIRAYAELAERARALGDADELARAERSATAALERFDAVLDPERFEEGTPAPLALAYRAVAAAELSRVGGESDPDAWKAAAERLEKIEMSIERAYAEWRQAEALLLASEARSEARELLSRAATTAAEAGATALLAEIEALARRARIELDGSEPPADEPAAADAADRLGLTDREFEVLELVAEGCTNREIGERLFISEKTASVHVSRILGKLGVRGRVEAATKAQRLGLFSAARS